MTSVGGPSPSNMSGGGSRQLFPSGRLGRLLEEEHGVLNPEHVEDRRENRHSGGGRRERGLTETVFIGLSGQRDWPYAARNATKSKGTASLNWIVTR